MAVFVNRHVFGGGPYSTRAGRFLREVGKPPRLTVEYIIAQRQGARRVREVSDDGKRIRTVARPNIPDPFVPSSFEQDLHPCGNSLGYMVQIAHILGAEVIYALGFTLLPNGPWHTGRDHPLGPKGRIPTDPRDCLTYLRWYDSRYPGRVRLLPGFQGPVYDALATEDLDAYRKRLACERPEPEGPWSVAREPVALPSE